MDRVLSGSAQRDGGWWWWWWWLRLSAGSLVKVTLQSPGCVESVAAAAESLRPAPAAAVHAAVELSTLDYAFAEINHIM